MLTKLRLAATCIFIFGSAASQGASMQITPVLVDLQATQTSSSVSLHNPGREPIYGQIRVFKWDQTLSEDVLTPATDVVASPPIIEVGAGSDQLVRLVRTDGAAPASEQSYRLVIDEIPKRDGTSASNQVTLRLRYSVPVFVASPAPATKPALQWRVLQRDGQWYVEAANNGPRRAQIGAMTLTNAAGQAFVVSNGLMGYALAGRTRQWLLKVKPDAALAGPIAIKVNVNGLPIAATSR